MRVLIADDSKFYRARLRGLIAQWGYEVLSARDGKEAAAILVQEHAPSLAVLDWLMPEMNGLEVCRLVRQSRKSYVYTLLLTAQSEQRDLVQGFDAGIDDYIRKPFHEYELKARLGVGERIIRAQRELVEMRNALEYQASHDALTGLCNSSAIRHAVETEIARSERTGHPFSIVLSDLDHFKKVNDRYGHLVGDAVLTEAAARMRQAIREYDALGRFGGEEFLAVLPQCDRAAANVTAERMRTAVCARPVMSNVGPVQITLSLGVCEWRAGLDSRALLSIADKSLYRAKTAGRNRVGQDEGLTYGLSRQGAVDVALQC